GLIEIARDRYQGAPNVRFSVAPASAVSLSDLGESDPFSRILAFGIFLYMNDDEARGALEAICALAAPRCRFVLREPIGLEDRLTIKEHFSEDMDQTYNA